MEVNVNIGPIWKIRDVWIKLDFFAIIQYVSLSMLTIYALLLWYYKLAFKLQIHVIINPNSSENHKNGNKLERTQGVENCCEMIEQWCIHFKHYWR